jgi:hypothetical protein
VTAPGFCAGFTERDYIDRCVTETLFVRLSLELVLENQWLARGVSRDGESGVRYGSNTFIEGHDIGKDVIAHAVDPLPLLVGVLQHEPEGEKILQGWDDLQWLQIDPQKLPLWSEPPAQPPRSRKYYGDE